MSMWEPMPWTQSSRRPSFQAICVERLRLRGILVVEDPQKDVYHNPARRSDPEVDSGSFECRIRTSHPSVDVASALCVVSTNREDVVHLVVPITPIHDGITRLTSNR